MNEALKHALELCSQSHTDAIYQAFGYKERSSKMPAEDAGTRIIDGIEFVLIPSHGYGGHVEGVYRMHVRCPVCGKLMSIGRLQQHAPTAHPDVTRLIAGNSYEKLSNKLVKVEGWLAEEIEKKNRGEYSYSRTLISLKREQLRLQRLLAILDRYLFMGSI